MTFNINKPIKNLLFLEVQLSKVIKNIVFLKVPTCNFDRGLLFEIAKRTSPIGVSKTSQNEHIPRSSGSHRISPDPYGNGTGRAASSHPDSRQR